jgi:formylmethanofuran dehydrogenase subunit C
MADGLARHRRTLIVQQAALLSFDGDLNRFIATGEMIKRKPIPLTPEVAAKVAEYMATGKLHVEPPKPPA